MIPAIKEYFGAAGSYATLHQATISFAEMGERTITTQVRIDGDVVPDFEGWELEFRGERFVLPIREPQATKDNSTRNSLVDLTFYSWAINEMKRYYFMSLTQIAAGTAIPDQYQASVKFSVENFVDLFNKVLEHYFGGQIHMDLFQKGQGIYSSQPSAIEINYTYIWDVLQKFYEIYNLRWKIVYENGVYEIKVGYPAESISDHDFEYGYEGGLIRFERQLQDDTVNNILLGRGGEKNLPYRYFKREDPDNPEWTADPDAIPELANIYFDRLRDANFRWYVRGWMQNSHRDISWEVAGHVYPTYSTIPEEYQYAYDRGRNDAKFNPVEFVRDTESIQKFGERWGALEDNDEIYPTIQGIIRPDLGRVDEVVAVSDIITDDIDVAAVDSATETNIGGVKSKTKKMYSGDVYEDTFRSESFVVPAGQTGNVFGVIDKSVKRRPGAPGVEDSYYAMILLEDSELRVIDAASGVQVPASGLGPGEYYCEIYGKLKNNSPSAFEVTFFVSNLRVALSAVEDNAWKPTFDIWVKNIWETTKGATESDEEYAARVWEPILGDRVGNEAKIDFSDGFMSISEDYEFTLAAYPVLDRSRTIDVLQEDGTYKRYTSEWRITLYKSDAEFDATGLFIPNSTTGGKPQAGDHFYFLGIDMPFSYVEWAEEEVTKNKVENLGQTKDTNPTWVISLDKVRVNTLEDGEYEKTLAEKLSVGSLVSIKDKRFTGGNALSLYIETISYTWNEPTENEPYLNPDIEIVLSDKVVAVQSPVEKIQSDVNIIRSSYVKSADLDATIRRITESLFLKKTGESDSSNSPTSFASRLSSKNFRQGAVGGQGWGHYEDGEGASVLELDKLIVREELQVNSLVANQIEYQGGKQIISAASLECVLVEEKPDGYICYFDQKRGSVNNFFKVGDIAMGQTFDSDNVEERYYRAVVTAVDVDSIKISKVDKDGSGIPEKGDVIVQFGNISDPARQYVIIRDVIGGGYERMLSGLSSVNASGNEYYFAGSIDSPIIEYQEFHTSNDEQFITADGEIFCTNQRRITHSIHPRWFVGDVNGEHAEWVNGELSIVGRVSVRRSDGTYQSMSDFISGMDYLREATNNGATLVDGGLILTNLIALGKTENEEFNIWAGINGLRDADARGKGIAAWFGGDMLDYDDLTPEERLTERYAKSLFRFDGSGYLAGGNIRWSDSGAGSIPGISWENGRVIISSNIYIESLQGNRLSELIALMSKFSSMFDLDANGDIQILNSKGLWGSSFISAGGIGASGGGGGGTDMVQVWQSLTANHSLASYDDDTKISARHLPATTYSGAGFVTAVEFTTESNAPTMLVTRRALTENDIPQISVSKISNFPTNWAWNAITGKPTTIGGYGITDAKIQNGVITLGNDTITPLTSGALDNYVTLHSSQVITGQKTFNDWIHLSRTGGIEFNTQNDTVSISAGEIAESAYLSINSPVHAVSFVKNGGTSVQFLKADGSVDNTAYVPITRTINGQALSSDITISNISGNAGTATRLGTSRSIWGQSFDGTSDVSGAMSGVTNIDNLLFFDSTLVRVSHLSVTNRIDLGGDGNITTDGAVTNFANDLHQFFSDVNIVEGILSLVYEDADEEQTYSGQISINNNYLSIATDTSLIRLEQDTFIAGSLQINNRLRLGNSYLEWDAENSAIKINGNIYATGYITAGGVNGGGVVTNFASLGFAQNVMYNPADEKPTFVEMLQRDGTSAIFSGPSKSDEGTYNLISMRLRNEVTQVRSQNNAFYPVAIAGKQFVNMQSGNCLPIYYNDTITVNPNTGEIRCADIVVSGSSIIAIIQQIKDYLGM